METLSLTIPYTANALGRASDMLHGMAADLGRTPPHVPEYEDGPGSEGGPDIMRTEHIEGGTKVEDIDPPAETSAPASGATENSETSPSAPDASRVDHKGVAFNSAYCGNAADPFYGTGKRKGQWKKRKGVDDADYDAWYTAQTEPAAVNTAGAFALGVASVPAAVVPKNGGELMAFISEGQAAGRFDQSTVTAAYAQAGVADFMEIFPPADPATIAQKISAIYNALPKG